MQLNKRRKTAAYSGDPASDAKGYALYRQNTNLLPSPDGRRHSKSGVGRDTDVMR
jgi:hypothetical protein